MLHTDGPKGVQVGETACYSDEDDEGSFVGESNFMEADFPVPASRVIICSGARELEAPVVLISLCGFEISKHPINVLNTVPTIFQGT